MTQPIETSAGRAARGLRLAMPGTATDMIGLSRHESARCRSLDAAKRNTRMPGEVSRGSEDSAGGNRLG